MSSCTSFMTRLLDVDGTSLMRMEKGTVIVVKKEPLVENLQEYRVRRSCIKGGGVWKKGRG